MKLFLFLLIAANALPALSEPVRPVPAHMASGHVFEMHVAKGLKRARLAVHHTNGDVVLVGKLRKRKIAIDFSDVQPGTYTIRLRKGARQHQYLFTIK